jgi:hypothetical protein
MVNIAAEEQEVNDDFQSRKKSFTIKSKRRFTNNNESSYDSEKRKYQLEKKKLLKNFQESKRVKSKSIKFDRITKNMTYFADPNNLDLMKKTKADIREEDFEKSYIYFLDEYENFYINYKPGEEELYYNPDYIVTVDNNGNY